MAKSVFKVLLPLIVFVVLNVLLIVYVRRQDSPIPPETITTINGMAYLIYVACGYIAGKLVSVKKVPFGLLTGLLCGLIATLVFGGAPLASDSMAGMVILGSLLGALGAVFSKYDAREKNRHIE